MKTNSTAQPFKRSSVAVTGEASPAQGNRSAVRPTAADEGSLLSAQPPVKINAGKWLRWAYENLSEHHYLLMLKAHRGGRA